MRPTRRVNELVWKTGLVFRIWFRALWVWDALRRQPLPKVMERLARQDEHSTKPAHPPARLSRAVDRSLRIGGWQPRCLVRSLVLCRLLANQGDRPELVIGLPKEAMEHKAHAWVELESVDVGPAPGRNGHIELARYK